MLREEIGDADEVVRLGGALDDALGFDHEGDDEVHRGVFRLPAVARVRRVLTQQSGDVSADGLRHHLGEFRGEALDQLARSPPAGVAVAPLDVPSNVLHVVGLEELLVVLPELQVGYDDGFANLSKGIAPREELVVDAVGNRGQEPDAGSHQVVLVGLQPCFRQQRPDVLHERLEEPLELLLVLLDVQVDVVADGGFHLVNRASLLPVLVVHRGQRGVVVAQELVKLAHPRVHVVLENLRELLAVQREEDAADQPQALEQVDEQLQVRGVRVDRRAHFFEQLEQRAREGVQDVLELLVQLVALVRLPVPLEDGVCGCENADDGAEVPGAGDAHALDELGQQTRPSLGEIRGGDDGQRLGELRLDQARGAEHEADEHRPHLILLAGGDGVRRGRADDVRLLLHPVVLHEVLKGNRGALSHGGVAALGREQAHEEHGEPGLDAAVLQELLRLRAHRGVGRERLLQA